MDCYKLFNILGLGLQLIGVLILAKSDTLARQIDAAYQSIPGNPLTDAYEAAKEGSARTISEEEKHYTALEAKADGHKALRIFKTSLLLVLLGMVTQLVVEILKP